MIKKVGWAVQIDKKTYTGYIIVEKKKMTNNQIADLAKITADQMKLSLQKIVNGTTDLDKLAEDAERQYNKKGVKHD